MCVLHEKMFLCYHHMINTETPHPTPLCLPLPQSSHAPFFLFLLLYALRGSNIYY